MLLVALSAANGANDVANGVATLAGAGVTRYRTALLWGTGTTLAGALLSVQLAPAMGTLFSDGIVAGAPTASFALAVLVGAAAWVVIATVWGMPVSTTHAIVGGLVGSGLVVHVGAVQWSGVANKIIPALLVSVVVAYALAGLACLAIARVANALRVRARTGPGAMRSEAPADRPGVYRETAATTTAPGRRWQATALTVAHWLSSGATGFARALNDTPKIAAVGAFALVPAGFSFTEVTFVVGVAMTVGCLVGVTVARTLGSGLVRLSHTNGAVANITTSALVGFGANLGLPMSTSQVATAAIVGASGGRLSRIHSKTVRDVLISWLLTPLVAGVVAAGALWTMREV